MLHELFLGLLGFPGDILVWSDGTMRVKDGFDLLTAGEREQISQVAPLGWYYVKLQTFVDKYSLQWGGNRNGGWQMYHAALSQGVSDILEEYTADVVYLEQIVLKEGPMPLSQVLLHMQKYLVCLPQVNDLLASIEEKGLHGCQILDHITRFQSGSPAVMAAVGHLLVRVRNVFLKQCVGWMLYGSLDDQAGEFFLHRRTPPSTSSAPRAASRGVDGQSQGLGRGNGDDALQSFFDHMEGSGVESKVLSHFSKLFKGTSSTANTPDFSRTHSNSSSLREDSFDWAHSYVLRVDNIPESHITPGLASKVLFAGKAVRLLQCVSGQEQLPEKDRDVYAYLSGEGNAGFKSVFGRDGQHFSFIRGSTSSSSPSANADNRQFTEDGEYVPDSRRNKPAVSPADDAEAAKSQLLQEHLMSCGYTSAQLDAFTRGFHLVLHKENMAAEILEGLIDDIHATISSKLWTTLRDSFRFQTTLGIVRNTFLMGKGELYQLLLDGITAQTFLPPRDTRQANLCLTWKVVRAASAVVGLPDDALSKVFRLRVNSNHLSIQAATAYMQAKASEEKVRTSTDSQPAGASSAPLAHSQLATLGDEDVCGVLFGGNATLIASKSATSPASGPLSCAFSLCPVPAATPESEVQQLFEQKILQRSLTLAQREADKKRESLPINAPSARQQNDSKGNDGSGNSTPRDYSVGAIWLSEPKYIAKGFDLACQFHCDWSHASNSLHSQHPWLVDASNGSLFDCNDESSVGAESISSDFSVGSLGSMSAMTSATQQSRRDGYIKSPTARLSLMLGCLTCCIHTDRRGTQMGVLGCDILGVAATNAVVAGVAFHMKLHRNKPQMFARIFVAVRSGARAGVGRFSNKRKHVGKDGAPQRRKFSSGSSIVSDVDGDLDNGAYGLNMRVIAETLIGIDDYTGEFPRSVSGSSSLSLDVQYSRNTPTSGTSHGGKGALNAATRSIFYDIKVRVIESSSRRAKEASTSQQGSRSGSTDEWDLVAPLEIPSHLKLPGGEAVLGFTSSGLIFETDSMTSAPQTNFGTYIGSLQFDAKSSLSAYPVASPFTISRFPETYVRLEKEMGQLRAWLGIQLRVAFPAVFHVIFDTEALSAYQRLFSLLMRIRIVAHNLERLWKTRSRLAQDRSFCQLRHSMHFFISNLLYYLQVDVVDSEYAALTAEVAAAADFQQVLRMHRNFLATVLRTSLVDNVTVQDSIERVIQSCLRFIAICRLLHQQEMSEENPGKNMDDFLDEDLRRFRQDASPNKGGWQDPSAHSPLFYPMGSSAEGAGAGPAMQTPQKAGAGVAGSPAVVVPPEEVESVRKEFLVQIHFLFQVMRKVENRGFMFRLDYNEYLSKAAITSPTSK